MSTASVPLPREAEAVLSWWLPRVHALLGDALRAVLLSGSVPLGDFEPGWSDVDICVQLEPEPTAALTEAIGRLHAEAEQRFLGEGRGGWRSTQLLEGPYLPASLAGQAGATGRFVQVDTGACRMQQGDPVPGFERYVLAHHAVVLAGDAIPFDPPSRARLVASQAWLPAHLARPASAHSAIMLAGLLQEAVRSLIFWRDGVFLGKTSALEREVARVGAWPGACRVALEVRRAGSAEATRHRDELEAAYQQAAGPAHDELLALLTEAGSAGEPPSA